MGITSNCSGANLAGFAYLARLPFPLDDYTIHTRQPCPAGTEGSAKGVQWFALTISSVEDYQILALASGFSSMFHTPSHQGFCRAASSAQGRDRGEGDVTNKILFFTLLTLTPIHFPAPSLGGSGADRMDRRGASACPGAVMTARQ